MLYGMLFCGPLSLYLNQDFSSGCVCDSLLRRIWYLTRFGAFFLKAPKRNLKYSVRFNRTDKCNTSIKSVKHLLLVVYTHNNNTTL